MSPKNVCANIEFQVTVNLIRDKKKVNLGENYFTVFFRDALERREPLEYPERSDLAYSNIISVIAYIKNIRWTFVDANSLAELMNYQAR